MTCLGIQRQFCMRSRLLVPKADLLTANLEARFLRECGNVPALANLTHAHPATMLTPDR